MRALASKSLELPCITYGVGVTIVNAFSQAYVEEAPFLVISGTAGTEEFAKNRQLHHLIDKSHTVNEGSTQLEIFENVTIDQGVLDDP